ncbi:hypothetical protein FACS1894182_13650 [Bacteroidia bacterium]|nr:hypothetical protein FACS1894182_13650 [Bacteroidia bacterium]
MNKAFFYLGVLLVFIACSPKISTIVNKNYAALDYLEDVYVFGVEEPAPANAESLGVVKIGDSGFSANCDWDVVIDKAKLEARKIGGNALKITKHTPPSIFGSSCHQITADILRVENWDNVDFIAETDSTLIGADYALLHVYRQSGPGMAISYDVHLGDNVICRARNKWKEIIQIYQDGPNTLWARTEAKSEIPIDIQFGKEYYIRCRIETGFFVGHPKLELVDNRTGKAEYNSIPEKKKK